MQNVKEVWLTSEEALISYRKCWDAVCSHLGRAVRTRAHLPSRAFSFCPRDVQRCQRAGRTVHLPDVSALSTFLFLFLSL